MNTIEILKLFKVCYFEIETNNQNEISHLTENFFKKKKKKMTEQKCIQNS